MPDQDISAELRERASMMENDDGGSYRFGHERSDADVARAAADELDRLRVALHESDRMRDAYQMRVSDLERGLDNVSEILNRHFPVNSPRVPQ